MYFIDSEEYIERIPQAKEISRSVSRGLHQAVLAGGPPVRKVVDLLHGVWLGHPLHPMLTDIVIGAWGFGSLFDLLSRGKHRRAAQQAADTLLLVGTVSAVPTALAGLSDFSTAPGRAIGSAGMHGIMNLASILLYTVSLLSRRAGNRKSGVFTAALALGLLSVSGWLGGELAYKYRVGINKSEFPKGPNEWKNVMTEPELTEGHAKRVDVDGVPVLFYRRGGTVYAMGAVCAHDGGPLDEGKIEDLCVECPWHQSVYDLRDGSVVHGPTTYAVPSYAARIVNGRVEVKLRRFS